MKLSIKIKLVPRQKQKDTLLKTIETYNEACELPTTLVVGFLPEWIVNLNLILFANRAISPPMPI